MQTDGSPELNIRLLGNLDLTHGREPAISIKSLRMQSLLAYLLVHRDSPQSRQHVAYVFWPDSTERQARTNLRRELHLLRRALPDADRFLAVDANLLQWQLDAPFTLDVARFESVVTHYEQAVQQGSDDTTLVTLLQEAVDLYTGDLLPACYDDWIIPERERLAQVFVRLLEALIELLESQRDYPAAIRYAQRLLRHDPLYETTYRRLMRLYALHGDRARALRVYYTCVTVLQRELGVDPSAATRETYQNLLDVDDSPVQRPTPPYSQVVESRLVGRQDEWANMQAAWRAAKQGPAHFLLVRGEAGIGKTRLVEELLEWAIRQGVVTARASCYAAEGSLAYAPVADLLRTDAFHNALLAVDKVWLAEVARLLPSLLVERPELPRPAPLTERGQRLRLFEALSHVVLADSQPLLLVIEDLQWCDRESLEWLHFLLRATPQRTLLVVGTARAEAVGPEHPLRELILSLRGTGQINEIEPGPLDREATALLAEQVERRNWEPVTLDALYAETEGNPLFIMEMLRAGFGQDDSLVAGASLGIAAQDVDGQRYRESSFLPPKVHAVILSRLGQLSAKARELVDLAATIGRSFILNVLAHACGETEDALVRRLDELWQRRIIREQGADAYDFSHDKIRVIAYLEISPIRRKQLHRRVAQALESVYAADLDAHVVQIAVHYEQAGVLLSAMRYYQHGAEKAQRAYANQETKALYARAINASQRIQPAPDVADLLPLYEGRGLVSRALTQLDEAIADFEIMRQLARTTGELQKEGEALCHLAYTHWLTFSQEQMAFVQQYAQEARELAEETGDQAVLGQSLTMLGAVDQVERNLQEAGAKLEEALAVSRGAGSQSALVQTLSFLCLQNYLQANFRMTAQYAREGIAVAREIQDDFNELRIQAFLCQSLWVAGRFDEALVLLDETMAQAEARGNKFIRGRVLNTRGWFHHEFCDFVNALAFNQESVEQGRASDIAHVEISALVNLGYDYLALRRHSEAAECLESTLVRVEREGFGAHKWRWQMKLLLGLGEHAYQTGNYEQALPYVERGLEGALATTSQKYIIKGRLLHGKIETQLGNIEAAGTDLKQAHSLAARLYSPSLLYEAAYALGHWHETMGQVQDAEHLYWQAQTTVEQMAVTVPDDGLRATFLQSDLVRAISERAGRTL